MQRIYTAWSLKLFNNLLKLEIVSIFPFFIYFWKKELPRDVSWSFRRNSKIAVQISSEKQIHCKFYKVAKKATIVESILSKVAGCKTTVYKVNIYKGYTLLAESYSTAIIVLLKNICTRYVRDILFSSYTKTFILHCFHLSR